ncbi:MAG: hypothetical protein ABEK01_05755 [Candidatus Nanohaloarchaea archaeon]
MATGEYHSMDGWEKSENTPGDPGYSWGNFLDGLRNEAVRTFNGFSRIRQLLDAGAGEVPGEGSLVELDFEEPGARVAYRIDQVYEDQVDPVHRQRDRFVLAGTAEEVVEGDFELEEVPQEIEIGYASDDWRVLEKEELEDPQVNRMYSYRNL